jgi:hypothetical protein
VHLKSRVIQNSSGRRAHRADTTMAADSIST